MNLASDIFQDLLELYPETAQNLKLKSLEKRSIFMYYKHKAERKQKRQNEQSGQYLDLKSKKAASFRSAEKLPLQYASTYKGPYSDSDNDELHITMPFAHGDDLHH